MTKLGYSLSSEERATPPLVAFPDRAERAAFSSAGISDHFHPWVDAQGESPFVWAVLGAIAERTERLELLTGVTCPTQRIHPVIVAQAAPTAAQLSPVRFSLGVGTGEALNEHVTGERWPSTVERQDRLAEAIEVIRALWEGEPTSHRGEYYRLENARIYARSEEPPPLLVAVAGERSVELAAEHGDGIIGTSPVAESVDQFRKEGGEGKPTYGQLHVCWAADAAEARRTAHRVWPNAAISGGYMLEMTTPERFEEAAENVREDD